MTAVADIYRGPNPNTNSVVRRLIVGNLMPARHGGTRLGDRASGKYRKRQLERLTGRSDRFHMMDGLSSGSRPVPGFASALLEILGSDRGQLSCFLRRRIPHLDDPAIRPLSQLAARHH